MPAVFMWYCRTRGGGRVWSAAGRSFQNKLHSDIRWRAVFKDLREATNLSQGPSTGIFDKNFRHLWIHATSWERCICTNTGHLSVCHTTQVKGTNQAGLLIRSRLVPCVSKQEYLPNKPVVRTALQLLTWLLVKHTITDALVKFRFSWQIDFRHYGGRTQLCSAACLDEEIYS
jgi:hypothetical protein